MEVANAGAGPYSPKASPPSSPRHPSEGEDVWPDDLDPAQVLCSGEGVLHLCENVRSGNGAVEGAVLAACAASSVSPGP